MTLPKLIAIAGPTASGKTGAAVALCRAIGGEVVSMDSMQIYQGMSIGTARVTPDEARGVPHHMTAIAPPDETYSVAEYAAAAVPVINDILRCGKVPVLAGGTGLYLEGVRRNRSYSQMLRDPSFTTSLGGMSDESLHDMLRSLDAPTAARLRPGDRRRVIRAIEVIKGTGGPPIADDGEPRFDILTIGLTIPRDVLCERIRQRVQYMLDSGLADEVRFLLKHGLMPSAQSMQAIGYKEMIRHLYGECTLEEAAERIIIGTRQYAKRQMTWFRRTENIMWMEPTAFASIEAFHESLIHEAMGFLG